MRKEDRVPLNRTAKCQRFTTVFRRSYASEAFTYPLARLSCVCDGLNEATFSRHLAKVICPTSDIREFVSSPFAKNISLSFFRNWWFIVGISRQPEGRYGQSSRNVGCGMRWTRRCRARGDARTNDISRTAKACGPDAPGLASSRQVMICRRR
jgi:hypothetical protein